MSSEPTERPGQIESVFENRVFGSGPDKVIFVESRERQEESGSGLRKSPDLLLTSMEMPSMTVESIAAVEPLSSIEIARLVGQGMTGRYLRRLSDGIPRNVLAATLGTDTSNFTKFYSRHLSKVQTDEINDLTHIWEELTSFFDGDAELRDEWLESSIPALSDTQPIELLGTIVGRQVIRETLDAMRYGEFA